MLVDLMSLLISQNEYKIQCREKKINSIYFILLEITLNQDYIHQVHNMIVVFILIYYYYFLFCFYFGCLISSEYLHPKVQRVSKCQTPLSI